MSYIKSKNKGTIEYQPKNPDKYTGEYPILCRSTWEKKFARWLDGHPHVVSGASEPNLNLTYQDPNTMKKRRYYPDFLFKVKDNNGKESIYLVEVKPYKETLPPESKKGKSRKTLLHEKKTWNINKAKGNAAKKLCDLKGGHFKLITEKQLYGI